ncbi:hypothetical protein PGB90_006870 [Kerria lacca]
MRKKNLNTNPPHMSISQWLNILNLNQYEYLFKKFKGIEDVMKYTEQDLKDLGVKCEVHRFQMASSLVALKSKYERTCKTGASSTTNDKIQRHSLAVDPSALVNQKATEKLICFEIKENVFNCLHKQQECVHGLNVKCQKLKRPINC